MYTAPPRRRIRFSLTLLTLISAFTTVTLLGNPHDARADSTLGPSGPLRVVVISDLNERYGDQFYRKEVHTAVWRIRALKPHLIVITGDMVAGQRAGLDYEGMWDAFDEAIRGPLADIPILVTPGNHDASEYSAYEAERDIYRQRWDNWPSPADFEGVEILPGGDYPFHYAARVGPAVFVSLDATARGALDSEQRQ
ncbi:MAG: metallophosphoesterase, partial [Myxococcales bacterium]|nr:metallophosphoesterase [Myxococcales bacterium]